ncbi:MAG: EAL domain-containing protein, partial [Candidatus Korobacteraceae bacterium]
VLLFDIYALYQQLISHRIRRRLAQREELLRLITDNARDMIAVVDMEGRGLYNSPSYQKVLGYSLEELQATSALEQIHPADRTKVAEAAAEAGRTGVGRTLEYRMRHRDGTWRTLESTASVIVDSKGAPAKMVIVNRDITARKRAEEQLLYRALHDNLTNLPNRALLADRLQQAFTHARRHAEYKFAVLFIDIDDFKKFNDSFGHTFGDQLIIEVGRRITESLRCEDTVSRMTLWNDDGETIARLGGDEFAVLLNDIRDPTDALRVANRIHQVLAIPFTINSHEVFASASIGIALDAPALEMPEDLLRDADIAMYRAKALGKNRCEVFDTEMHARAVHRLKLETDLRRAVEREEFRVHYQPIISLQNGRIAGLEALLRWEHPELGLLSPGDFIPIAEATGLIVPISRWVMFESCRQLRLWHLLYPSDPPLSIAVNISSKELARPDLVDNVRSALQYTGIDPHCLWLEITETAAMEDADMTRSVLTQLKELDICLSIDDFGTGYSSLTRLQSFPVDTLKIDRSFINNMDKDTATREIVRVIIMLGQHLGLKLVAEGTERIGQVNDLKELGCEFAQGYFFSKPVNPGAVEKLLMAEYSHGAAVPRLPHSNNLAIDGPSA